VNCLALLTKAHALCSKFPSSTSSSTSIPKLDVDATQSKSLSALIQALVFQYHGLVELRSLSAQAATPDKQKTYTAPLIDNLDQYPPAGVDLTNLVNYPPKLQPIPVKPLFFDIAWNYIEYPGRQKPVVENGVKGGTGEGTA
jgi:signal recognition particle subunit SRP68